jgi:hypothetical protein
MKRIIFLALLLCAFSMPTWANPFLVCDPAREQDLVIESRVHLDGEPYPWIAYEERSIFNDGKAYCVLLDLEGLPDGEYTARAQFRMFIYGWL